MNDAAGQSYWNSVWDGLPPIQPYAGPVFEQHPVLRRFLDGRGEAIEIVCVPGTWMIYLNKEYGYRVSGLDYSEHLDYTRANLQTNGVLDAELFRADLFQFNPPHLYDVVFSAGFVEHFDDFASVIQRHSDLARCGGLVVIIVPNAARRQHR